MSFQLSTLPRRYLFALRSRRFSTVTVNDSSLTIPSLNNATFPYIWLRDSCQSVECIHSETTQKLHCSTDFDVDIRPKTVKIIEPESSLHIEWPDGHISLFHKSFLERHSSKENLARFRKDVGVETWDRKDVEERGDLFVNYGDIKKPGGLLGGIDQILRQGLLFVRGVPTSTTDPEFHLASLALQFTSEIRETFYGRIFHVQNKADTDNIAYTNLKLGLHMDLLYFEHPPRYQILHCISNRVQGGSSVFSDSFHAARQLKSRYPQDYKLLARTPVPFEYLHGEHHLHCSHPTIELESYSPSLDSELPVKYVNYSPPFQAPLFLSPTQHLRQFYSALERFAELLNSPENMYEYTLQEGDAVIFDNRRVLHARTAFKDYDFTEKELAGPSRWLQGCYFEGDTMRDRGRVLRAKLATGASNSGHVAS